ncbi:MAG: hypothetical protein IK138_09525 [Lachnospiraceae bacterium]|nr:hypothetical protein [Lachnospiraceae bacterium]
MTVLEIILLLLGIAFIVISCFIIDRGSSDDKETGLVPGNSDELKEMGENIKQNINGEAGRIIADAQDKLESLSNDKIIAVGEYSDQVIEKIEADHKEAVFLYQMLCEKEEELKEMTNRMSTLKTECERVLMEEKEDAERKESYEAEMEKLRAELEAEKERAREELENEMARAREELEKERELLRAKAEPEVTEPASEPEPGEEEPEPETAEKVAEPPIEKKPTAKAASGKAKTKSAASKTSTVKKTEPARKSAWESVKATDSRDTRMLSRNDEIIALYKQNKSVMEISRLLQMGQGEVKLIIDLYCR